ncbi:MAG: hypothetical protein V3S46_07150 [Nitrospinota bacterium]
MTASAAIRPMVGLMVLAIALVLAAGCSTKRVNLKDPNRITKEKITLLKNRVTTKKEVEAIFGPPLDIIPIDDGETYFYKDFNLGLLWIAFDAKGVVVEFKSDY